MTSTDDVTRSRQAAVDRRLKERDEMTTLRAEVERLRAVVAAAHRDSGADAAYATVLDLIDKQREQQ